MFCLRYMSRTELEKVNQYIDIIGVNNRDLKTFKVDTETFMKSWRKIFRQDFSKFLKAGSLHLKLLKSSRTPDIDGFLIGEKFMVLPIR